MHKYHKIELKPNNKQVTMFKQHCGVARHAWNWGLSECIKVLEIRKLEKESTGKTVTKFPSAMDLHKRLVAEVKKENPWYYESSKCAPQEALRNLEKAFKRVFKVKGTGFPKFKKKTGKKSFYLQNPNNGGMRFCSKSILLPVIGKVRVKESPKPGVIIKEATISERAGRWFLSYRCEFIPTQITSDSVIGVDLGIKTLATLSDGSTHHCNRDVAVAKQIIRLQRRLSKSKKGSGRRERLKLKLQRTYYRLSNIRKDVTHKLTSHLAKNHGVIVIEDLCVSGMVKNHHLAASIMHSNLGEIRRQLEYKCAWYGSQLVVVDRWFASSQICSGCGSRKKMPLSNRIYSCDSCGLEMDRDLNAAKNLAASPAVTARRNPEVTVVKTTVPELPREVSFQ